MTSSWTAVQAWDYLVKEVLNAADVLHYFAYATGITDIDGFLYLGRSDFETTFEVRSEDAQGTTMTTSQVLTRALIGKRLRAQAWYDSQIVRDYDVWGTLTISTLNGFRGTTSPVTPTASVNSPTSLPYCPTPGTP
jgi:hypothetical protein